MLGPNVGLYNLFCIESLLLHNTIFPLLLDEFLIAAASAIFAKSEAAGQVRTASIKWNEEKSQNFNNKERCFSFFVFLSGSFELARVLVEKDNDTFDLYHEIQGPFNEWKEARFKLVQEKGETIWLEAVTSQDSELGNIFLMIRK